MTACIRVGSIALFLCASACGSGSGSGGSSALSGTVHGQTIGVTDAISAALTTMFDDVTIHGAAIVMANASDLCADAVANRLHPNEKAVVILLTDVTDGASSTPTAAGTYTIFQGAGKPPAKTALLSVSMNDAACKEVEAQSAGGATGTVTLSAISGDEFSGSFDVTLNSGDRVTGSFAPGACPELATLLNRTSEPSCM